MCNSTTPKQHYTPFQWLQFSVADTHWRWRVWKQLFMASPEKPEEVAEWPKLMNSFAPVFFDMLDRLLFKDVVLSICKLVDPAESPTRQGPRRNFSLKAIALDEAARLGASKSDNAKSLIDAFVTTSQPLITWRNWSIAHDDYLVATGAEPLPPLTGTDVERAIASAVEIMTLLDATSATSEYRYDGMMAHGDGESIKYALRMAEQYRKECLAVGVRPLSGAAKVRAANL
ncbi:MAG TPA: hypothetical protein PKE29_11235 [Phycisphaerales bacterium]|nr:hypothetical protein [Phycisphaerales bacterium]